VTNVDLGAKLGISHAQVSRLRSGDRSPTLATLVSVQKTLGWPVADQVKAFEVGTYAAGFEDAIKRYGAVQASDVA
jgi:transcriptional regulator with XRE-family HTH domain